MKGGGSVSRAMILAGFSMVLVASLYGLGEIALRVFAPGRHTSVVEYEPVRGWHGRPGAHIVFERAGFSIEVVHNSMGYRDAERTVVKPDEVCRILCCGDSFTWGWGVEQDEIYTHVLERICRRLYPRTEVLNAGVSGQNTTQALLGLLDHGFAYEPDLVVYQASDNDIRGNMPPDNPGIWVSPYHVLEGDELRLVGSPVPPPAFLSELKYRAALHSRLAYLLRYRLHILLSGISVEREAPRADPARGDAGRGSDAVAGEDPSVGEPFRLFCAIVGEMDEQCARRGVRFVVLIDFPLTGGQLLHWRDTCGDVETLLIDGFLTTRERTSGRSAFIEGDGHWTVDGHLWVAEYLFENAVAPMLESCSDGWSASLAAASLDSDKVHRLRY